MEPVGDHPISLPAEARLVSPTARRLLLEYMFAKGDSWNHVGPSAINYKTLGLYELHRPLALQIILMLAHRVADRMATARREYHGTLDKTEVEDNRHSDVALLMELTTDYENVPWLIQIHGWEKADVSIRDYRSLPRNSNESEITTPLDVAISIWELEAHVVTITPKAVKTEEESWD